MLYIKEQERTFIGGSAMKKTREVDRNAQAREQAWSQLKSIKEMVAALDTRDNDEREAAQQMIQEDPLEITVRTGWKSPNAKDGGPEDFCILLCTGGPAVRILGDLDENYQPIRPRLQFQDWFTSWEELICDESDQNALEMYCQQFYFGG